MNFEFLVLNCILDTDHHGCTQIFFSLTGLTRFIGFIFNRPDEISATEISMDRQTHADCRGWSVLCCMWFVGYPSTISLRDKILGISQISLSLIHVFCLFFLTSTQFYRDWRTQFATSNL
jgi:hypothetical protein